MEADGNFHPLVGAVILNREGKEVAGGSRRGDKKKHAEVVAIENLVQSGKQTDAHTLITTLEPCSYRNNHEQEICCAKRVVRLGIKQVIIGTLDPAYGVRGRGSNILQAREVYFTMFPEKFKKELNELNKDYIKFHSELLLSAAPRAPRSGIVQDDQEFDLGFAPSALHKVLTSPEFQRVMSAYHVLWANLCVAKSVPEEIQERIQQFEIFVTVNPDALSDGATSMKSEANVLHKQELDEKLRLILWPYREQIAMYKAVPPTMKEDDEWKVICGIVANWWYSRSFPVH